MLTETCGPCPAPSDTAIVGAPKRVKRVKCEGVLWEGLSPFDGSPIVAIATDATANPKTGPMVQVWILPALEMGNVARREGRDASVCGMCPQRWSLGGGCYVAPMGISSVSRKWLRGGYKPVSLEAFRGRLVRWGAYGDPAMLPESLVRAVNAVCALHTGYTHQHRHAWAQWTRGVFMASADTQAQAVKLRADGWGVFQVAAADGSDRAPRAVQCAADRKGSTCAECKACDGRKTSIWIAAHGARTSSTVAERKRLRVLAA